MENIYTKTIPLLKGIQSDLKILINMLNDEITECTRTMRLQEKIKYEEIAGGFSYMKREISFTINELRKFC